MAVPKRRKTRSKRDMRRNHTKLRNISLSTDVTTGEIHLRHHITKEGYYRGKKILKKSTIKKNSESET